MRGILAALAGAAPPTTLPAEYVGRIVASDGEPSERYGYSITLSATGEYLFVGSPYDDDVGANGGAVYVYRRVGGVYIQQQKILCPVAGLAFGFSIATDDAGQRLIVGTNGGLTLGRAWVYLRTGVTWAIEQECVPTVTGGGYGYSVSMSEGGNVVAIGAPYQTVTGTRDGAVFVQSRSGSVWSEQQRLGKTGGALNEGLGQNVAISKNGLYIVATGGPNSTVTWLGVVFFLSGSWSQQQVLGNTITTQNATVCLSADGSRAFILDGYYTNGTNAGRVILYERSGTFWVATYNMLVPPPRSAGVQNFPDGVACNGAGTLVVFAGGTVSIARYELTIFFRVGNGEWMNMGYAQTRDAVTGSIGYLAAAMSKDGKTAALGVEGYDGTAGTNSGAAWIFTTTDNLGA